MNRSDLIQLLADQFSQLSQTDAKAYVSTNLDTTNRALARGHRNEISGLGSFAVIHRAPRLGRNPRSGSFVDIPEGRQAQKALLEAVNLPAVDVAYSQPK
jgi:integration host factor subunit beta